MFVDRQHAGKLLAERVKQYLSQRAGLSSKDLVVIGLPRGGVVCAAEVAIALDCLIDILVSKKIGAPDNPELAIGAVSSGGEAVLDEHVMRLLGSPQRYIEAQRKQKERLMTETRQLEERWTKAAGFAQRADLTGKVVILVDDGIATGMTTMAAIKTLRARAVAEIVLAVPVVPYDTYNRLKSEVDEFIALSIPYDFIAVGYFYKDFAQVEDSEMVAALKRAASAVISS